MPVSSCIYPPDETLAVPGPGRLTTAAPGPTRPHKPAPIDSHSIGTGDRADSVSSRGQTLSEELPRPFGCVLGPDTQRS